MSYIVNYTDTFDGTLWDDEEKFETLPAAIEKATSATKNSGPMFTARVFAEGSNGPALYVSGKF